MKFSICIPVFNMETTIVQCIRSALSQEHNDFEVIVLDNCSTDRTYQLAVEMMGDQRLRVLRNASNLGAYGNHNAVVQLAGGIWIKFLHGDDELLPNCLSSFEIALYQCPSNVALLSCGAIQLDQNGNESFRTLNSGELFVMRSGTIEKFILEGNIFGTPSMCLINKTKLVELGGFDTNMEPGADADMWINLRTRYSNAIMPNYCVLLRDDPPGSLAQRAARLKDWSKYTVRLATKWLGAPILDNDSKVLFKKWVQTDCLRFWSPAFKLCAVGRPDGLLSLWKVLREKNLQWSAFISWLRLMIRRKSAAAFRDQPWWVTLSGLRLPSAN